MTYMDEQIKTPPKYLYVIVKINPSCHNRIDKHPNISPNDWWCINIQRYKVLST